MDPNNNPVAPTDAPAPASVASTTNSNEQAPFATPPANGNTPVNSDAKSGEMQMAEPTPEQIAKYLGTTPESLEKFKKFSDNNGGFDKIFTERKQEISAPKSAQVQSPAPGQSPLNDSITQTPQVTTQQNSNSLNQEYLEARIVKDYFKELAENPDYANIAAQLKDGTVMEEASKRFGINPIANGKINEGPIKQFCDMYVKTMPAAPASAPMTNTPTVQPMGEQFTGPINTTQDALKVIQEHNMMVASGKGDHSKYKEAQEFLNKGFRSRHPVQNEFQPWQSKKG